MKVNIYIVESRKRNIDLPTNYWHFEKAFLDKSEAILFVRSKDNKENNYIICKQNDYNIKLIYAFNEEGKVIKIRE